MQKSYERLKNRKVFQPYPKREEFAQYIYGNPQPLSYFLLLASSVYLSTVGTKAETDLLQQYIPIAEMRSLTLPDGTKSATQLEKYTFISAGVYRR